MSWHCARVASPPETPPEWKSAQRKKSSYFIGVGIGVNGVAGVASVTRNSICFCVSPIQKHLSSDVIFALLSESNANWEWAGNQLRARAANCKLQAAALSELSAAAASRWRLVCQSNWLTAVRRVGQRQTHHRISCCTACCQCNCLTGWIALWMVRAAATGCNYEQLLQFIKCEFEYKFKFTFICQLVECEIKRFTRLMRPLESPAVGR